MRKVEKVGEVEVMEGKPWDRQPGEPMIWFARLERYRMLGMGRTVDAVWRQEPVESRGPQPSRHWYAAAAKWRWIERVEAWDMENLAETRRQFREAAAKDKEERIALLEKARKKVTQALLVLDVSRPKFAEVMTAVRIITNELRSEYDDQPSQRHRFTMEELDREIERRARLLQLRSEGAVVSTYAVLAESDASDDGWADEGDSEVQK